MSKVSSSVNSSTTSATVLAYDGSRIKVTIKNTDANKCYLLLGFGTASATTRTVQILPTFTAELTPPESYQAMQMVWSADGAGGADIVSYFKNLGNKAL